MASATPSLYARLRDLPLVIEGIGVRTLSNPAIGWERLTTEVTLHGGGHDGRGEDVTWDVDMQRAFPAFAPSIAEQLIGAHTIGSFDTLIDEVTLFPDDSDPGIYVDYRRWACAAAALDLGLRQSGESLADLLDIPAQPLRFANSMNLGEEPNAAAVTDWLQFDPDMEFKLDATDAWSDELAATLGGTNQVRVIDLKAYYEYDHIRQDFDVELYERVARCFPDAYIEDAATTVAAREALGGAVDRLSFDAPIHAVGDVTSLGDVPSAINIKPSRFGTWKRMLDTIDHCVSQDIALYGGGQFELGIGRTQAQQLAALCYPDAPNDIAPVVFHTAQPGPDTPTSPLEVPFDTGFGFVAAGAR